MNSAGGKLFSDPAFRAGVIAADLRTLRAEVRVLSLWQPWAGLVAAGVKRFETRSWSTKWRGLVAVHAARTTVCLRQVPAPVRAVLERNPTVFGPLREADPPLGAVVALVQVEDCLSTGPWYGGQKAPEWLEALGADERASGDFGPGRFAWRLSRVGYLAKPIPFRNGQGLRKAPAHLVRLLADELRPFPGSEEG